MRRVNEFASRGRRFHRPSPREKALCTIARSGPYVGPRACDRPEKNCPKGLPMPDALKLGFTPSIAPRAFSLCSAPRTSSSDRHRKGARAGRRSLSPRRRRRPLYRQERVGPRNHRAGRPECAPPGRDRHRQGERTKDRDILRLGGVAMGKVPAPPRKQRSSQSSAPARSRPNRSPIWRSARGCAPTVRPLQDQAQGRRGAGGQGRGEFRLRQPGRRRASLGARQASPTASYWRATSSTSRPMCFIPESSPAARRSEESSASPSKCSMCRR